MSTNPIIESPIEIKPDVVDLVILSQSEDIRKLLLLKETIKRFSKKRLFNQPQSSVFSFAYIIRLFQIMQIFGRIRV